MTQELQTVQPTAHTWRRPRYDVSETDDTFSIQVVMPGVSREAVDISIEAETLNITGTRTNRTPEDWRPLRRELPEGDYRLNLRLNVPVDASKIAAHVDAGVLDLSLPKAEEIKPRKIKIH
ncbi:MAG: Hsp20/alpha crystallin family protein [Opitutales bacterium]|jgi:HSP20 family protein